MKNQKFTKRRVGVREAKRLEQLDDVGAVLNADECTMCRARAATALYLSLDRPDIQYSAKELCREFASPTRNSVTKLKRLVRYLVAKPRLVGHFAFEAPSTHLDVFSDTDFGGCLRTRRTTSGGVARLCTHVIKSCRKTQGTVALSSAGAELTGICHSAGEALGLRALPKTWASMSLFECTAMPRRRSASAGAAA